MFSVRLPLEGRACLRLQVPPHEDVWGCLKLVREYTCGIHVAVANTVLEPRHREQYLWVAFQKRCRALKSQSIYFSPANKIVILQCNGKIFCVEFQRAPLKFHTKYLTHTLKDADRCWNYFCKIITIIGNKENTKPIKLWMIVIHLVTSMCFPIT